MSHDTSPWLKELFDELYQKFENKRIREMDTPMISVPLHLIKAVSMIGVDFGYGPYELEQSYIHEAQAAVEAHYLASPSPNDDRPLVN